MGRTIITSFGKGMLAARVEVLSRCHLIGAELRHAQHERDRARQLAHDLIAEIATLGGVHDGDGEVQAALTQLRQDAGL